LSPYFAQMDIGVPVFFVISGFLLYRPFVAARLSGRPSMGAGMFWWRRALRIFPAYWVALIAVSTLFDWELSRPIDSVKAFIEHFFLLQVYSSDRVIGGPVQQSWTLAVEVAFYLFLPIYAWCVSRARPRRASLLGIELGGVALLYVA
ncbi:MAG: acyltransferase, partial [Actinobacteria bacterium]